MLDVFFVVYLLFYIGIVVVMVLVSDNWWDPWPGVVILSCTCLHNTVADTQDEEGVYMFSSMRPRGQLEGTVTLAPSS
jgi:hypothetical protein